MLSPFPSLFTRRRSVRSPLPRMIDRFPIESMTACSHINRQLNPPMMHLTIATQSSPSHINHASIVSIVIQSSPSYINHLNCNSIIPFTYQSYFDHLDCNSATIEFFFTHAITKLHARYYFVRTSITFCCKTYHVACHVPPRVTMPSDSPH